MKNLKVVTIVGTRPEIIRLSALIPKLDKFTDHVLVHTGQNSDPTLSDVFFDEMGIRSPDYFLEVDTTSLGSTLGTTLSKVEKVFKDEAPDAVMILGDTNSAISAVIAERMHIPVYHMEAGNRSFDARVPEELNRVLVDHVATFNLPYNSHSRGNLLAEGLHPRFLNVTGSPLTEVLTRHRPQIMGSNVLTRLNLVPKDYFLASFHRQENVDSKEMLSKLVASLVHAHKVWGKTVVVSTHPRSRARINELPHLDTTGLRFHEPFGFFDYNSLQSNAFCVISDSGSISEESAILNFPAVTIRESMERPEALEAGSIIMTGLDPDSLERGIKLSIDFHAKRTPEGYGGNDFSERVLKFLFSTAGLSSKWKGL